MKYQKYATDLPKFNIKFEKCSMKKLSSTVTPESVILSDDDLTYIGN